MGDFANRVFEVVKRIPEGRVATYGQIARLIGAPRSARYVGYALRANPEPGTDPDAIPCHRVVFKDGALATGFAFGGESVQRALLAREGVVFGDDGRVDMASCQWDGIPERDGSTSHPSGPPPDFDWERELAEFPLKHPRASCDKDCATCAFSKRHRSYGIIEGASGTSPHARRKRKGTDYD